MKSYIRFSLSGLMLIMATLAFGQANNYDDVYYSPKNSKPDNHSMVVKPLKVEDNQKSEGISAPDQVEQSGGQLTDSEAAVIDAGNDSVAQPESSGNNNITNNFYGDDYYDYAYSARLRRFHNDCFFNNYYSDFYTNSYWYDYDPWNWGMSIYMGYNWWYPSYYSRWYMPWYSWGYSNWWDPYPYYGWGGFGYSYYAGYWNGFYDGYWNGMYHGDWGHNYYYNSYDDNSHYYGRRRSVGSSGSFASSRRDMSFSEKYEASIARERNGNLRNSVRNTDYASARRSGAEQNIRQSSINQGNTTQRNTGTQVRTTPGTGNQNPAVNRQQQKPTRYTYQGTRTRNYNSTNEGTRNQGNIQPYSSPSYSKPRSGQEYTSPKYRNTTPATGNQGTYNRPSSGSNTQSPARQYNKPNVTPQNTPNRSTTQPGNSRNTYSVPKRTTQSSSSPSTPTYSAPSRSNDNYSPSRNSNSYSTPSRSSDYSSPSRSSGSYSAPSRSSESSSPSRSNSSSGSSSGRRR